MKIGGLRVAQVIVPLVAQGLNNSYQSFKSIELFDSKQIVIKKATHERMMAILKPIYKETYDQMIKRLLDFYEQGNKNG